MKSDIKKADIKNSSDVEDIIINDIINGDVILDYFWLSNEVEIIDEEQEDER